MTIYDILKKEHRTVKKLFRQIEREENPSSQYIDSTFQQIQRELDVHMRGEETFFYPPLEQNEKTRPDTLEAIEEHALAKQLIKDISGMSQTDPERMMAKIRVLKEVIEHHIKEEEGTLFDDSRDVLTHEQMKEITVQYEEEKKKAQEPVTAGV